MNNTIIDHEQNENTAQWQDFIRFGIKWSLLLTIGFILLDYPLAYARENIGVIYGPINSTGVLLAGFIALTAYLILRNAINTLIFDFVEKWWALILLLFCIVFAAEFLYNFVMNENIVSTFLPQSITSSLNLRQNFSLYNIAAMSVFYVVLAVISFRSMDRKRH